MKKILFLIIGMILTLLGGATAHAQVWDGATSYCDSLSLDTGYFELYRESYCDVSDLDDSDLFDALADQFQVESELYDADLIEQLFNEPSQATLNQYLDFRYGSRDLSKLPPNVRDAFYGTEDSLVKQNAIWQRLKTAYDREKIYHQSASSLKNEFKAVERWQNGTTIDSPFDLIVDLNLVEIALFGRLATWTDDVYSFNTDGGSNGGPGGGPGSGPAGGTNGGSNGGGVGPIDAIPIPELECVPVGEDGGNDDTPGAGEVPANCGDGAVDAGEDCDDGNNLSGDGCSSACTFEDGPTLTCRDPGALTFRLFEYSTTPTPPRITASTPVIPERETPPLPISCPPGTEAVDRNAEPVGQSEDYLGPFVGGVLKRFPASEPPTCPAGQSEVQVSFATGLLSNLPAVPRCIPTEFCAGGDASSFEPVRELLFGSNYKNDPEKAKAAAAIESFVCVNVTTFDRPDSPYNTNEGCIDCHVLAMNDVMDELLNYNVAPLENNFQAWGLSNRWGPNVHFDLSTELKTGVALPAGLVVDTSQPDPDGMMIQKLLQDASHQLDPNESKNPPAAAGDDDQTAILNRVSTWQALADQEFSSSLKAYRLTRGSTKRVNQGQSVSSMLLQVASSFERIQNVFVNLTTELEFDAKGQCTFN